MNSVRSDSLWNNKKKQIKQCKELDLSFVIVIFYIKILNNSDVVLFIGQILVQMIRFCIVCK